jgi:hypothetical protein
MTQKLPSYESTSIARLLTAPASAGLPQYVRDVIDLDSGNYEPLAPFVDIGHARGEFLCESVQKAVRFQQGPSPELVAEGDTLVALFKQEREQIEGFVFGGCQLESFERDSMGGETALHPVQYRFHEGRLLTYTPKESLYDIQGELEWRWALYVFRHPDGRETLLADHGRRDPSTMGMGAAWKFIEKRELREVER